MANFTLEFNGKYNNLKSTYGTKKIDFYTTKNDAWLCFRLDGNTVVAKTEFVKTFGNNPKVFLYAVEQEDGTVTRILRSEEIHTPEVAMSF